MDTKRYVLTGGPGVGKSTTIRLLQDKGFEVVSETAQEIIESEMRKQAGILPWTDLYQFQEIVLEQQLQKEESAISSKVFLDRSIIDGHAYCILGNIQTPTRLHESAIGRYDKIFVLDPLPTYENNSYRKEDKQTALRAHAAIQDAYRYFGYDIISIPPIDPDERVRMILAHVQ